MAQDASGRPFKVGDVVYCTLPKWMRGDKRVGTLFQCRVQSVSDKKCIVVPIAEDILFNDPTSRFFNEIIRFP